MDGCCPGRVTPFLEIATRWLLTAGWLAGFCSIEKSRGLMEAVMMA